VDPFFASIFKGAAATTGRALDCRKGQPVSPATARSAPSSSAAAYSTAPGAGEAGRLCVPDGGGLRHGRRILQECHDTPLGGHFGGHKTAALVRRLAYWPGQTRDVEAYFRTCEVCRRTKAEPVGPRGLLHPLPLPTRRGGVIGVDWLVVEMALRSGDGVPDVLVVDHDSKFTSNLFREFTRRIGSSLLVGSYHNLKNTNARAERVNGVLGNTLRAFANGRKVDWDVWLQYAFFAINNAAATLGGGLTPFSIDRGQHPRLPLSLPDLRSAKESPSAYGARVRMKALDQEVQALLHAAQQDRKTTLDRGRVARWATRCCSGRRSCSTRRRLASCYLGGRVPFRVRVIWPAQRPTPWPSRAASGAARPSTLSVSSPTMPARTNRTHRAQSPTRARRASTWWSSSSTARSSGAELTTWCGGRGTTPRTTPSRGSRRSTSRIARSGWRSTRRLRLAVPRPAGRRPPSPRGPSAPDRAAVVP
jgi:hypothetical protein